MNPGSPTHLSPFNISASKALRLLPPLPDLPCPEYRGPTDWSNWVIKGRLIAGAYPACNADDAETERLLTTLLELDVDTFVCLQAEFNLEAAETEWRANRALRPYIYDAQKLIKRARKTNNPRILQNRLDFLHLPIIDGSVTSDHALSRLADDCCQRILNGERLYVHCWGGHGRTGSLITVMLSRLYGLPTDMALAYTQAMHDSRKYPQGVRSPQTKIQVIQVSRLLSSEPIGARGGRYTWPTEPLSDALRALPPAPALEEVSLKAGTGTGIGVSDVGGKSSVVMATEKIGAATKEEGSKKVLIPVYT